MLFVECLLVFLLIYRKSSSINACMLTSKRLFVFPGRHPFAWPPALATKLYLPALVLNFVFTGHGPQFVFTGPGPKFVFTGPDPQFITSPGSEFCIYRSCLLNLYLYLRPWSTICITCPGPEFAFTLLLVVEAAVVVIVVAVISLE